MARKSTPVLVTLVLGGVAVVVAGLLLVTGGGSPPPAPQPVLTADARAYLPEIEVTDAKMSAARNFLGDTVTYLDARVTNKGTKLVRRLDLELEFVDTLNQVVLRDAAHPITARMPPLQPGETRAFRVSFEHMPIDWNQAPPTITPRYVGF